MEIEKLGSIFCYSLIKFSTRKEELGMLFFSLEGDEGCEHYEENKRNKRDDEIKGFKMLFETEPNKNGTIIIQDFETFLLLKKYIDKVFIYWSYRYKSKIKKNLKYIEKIRNNGKN